ncbi:hypothetical protein LX36DRAFT_499874 [Colletotrichum falcatum]|nr:hypothetical protein LX36DRAFT_499874 [Colletotrichum falcatum]
MLVQALPWHGSRQAIPGRARDSCGSSLSEQRVGMKTDCVRLREADAVRRLGLQCTYCLCLLPSTPLDSLPQGDSAAAGHFLLTLCLYGLSRLSGGPGTHQRSVTTTTRHHRFMVTKSNLVARGFPMSMSQLDEIRCCCCSDSAFPLQAHQSNHIITLLNAGKGRGFFFPSSVLLLRLRGYQFTMKSLHAGDSYL